MKPIRAKCGSGKPIMEIGDVSLIFSSVEGILQLHQGNLIVIEKKLEEWPFVEGFGDVS